MDIKVLGVLGFVLAFALVIVLVTAFSKRSSAGQQDAASPSDLGRAKPSELGPAKAAASSVRPKAQQAGKRAV